MTTPQDIQAALDAFKMINRGPAESPNENEIMFNGFLLEKEVRIIEQILQSHAPEASTVDALKQHITCHLICEIGTQVDAERISSRIVADLLRRGMLPGDGV